MHKALKSIPAFLDTGRDFTGIETMAPKESDLGSQPETLLSSWVIQSRKHKLPGPQFPFLYNEARIPPSTSFLSCVLSCSVVSDSHDAMDHSPPGSSVHGISHAKILEWVAISCSSDSSQSRHRTRVSCIAGRFLTN